MPHLPYLYDSIGEEVSGSHRTMIQNGEADAHSRPKLACKIRDRIIIIFELNAIWHEYCLINL